GAYYITCQEVVKDPRTGEVLELRCTYDPESRGGESPDGRKVKATLHWVSAAHGQPAEVRLYEPLFLTEDPDEGGDFLANLNPNALQIRHGGIVEHGSTDCQPGEQFQFLRHGYFAVDPDSRPGSPVFNRIVSLRDAWAKIRARDAESRQHSR